MHQQEELIVYLLTNIPHPLTLSVFGFNLTADHCAFMRVIKQVLGLLGPRLAVTLS